MKHIFLFCLLIPVFSFAQTENAPVVQPKNEFGLNLFSIDHLTWNNYSKNKYAADFGYFSGIYYKLHFGKNVWRSSFDYSQKTIVNNNNWAEGYYSSIGTKKSGETKVGYQRNFCSGKFSPYVFSDFSFTYSKYSGIDNGSGCFMYFQNRPFIIESFTYGIAGGVGAKYQIGKNIVISIESSAMVARSFNEDLLNHSPNYPKYKSIDNKINPLNRLGFALIF